MRSGWMVAAPGLTSAVAVNAPAQTSPVVVELFTSQSCSSCPPADAFLTDLARQRRDLLPLPFHVTYWNDLGWKDPFSFEAATARQRGYAAALGDDHIYTPEMVVNGVRSFVGSDREQGLSGISRAERAQGPYIPLTRRPGWKGGIVGRHIRPNITRYRSRWMRYGNDRFAYALMVERRQAASYARRAPSGLLRPIPGQGRPAASGRSSPRKARRS